MLELIQEYSISITEQLGAVTHSCNSVSRKPNTNSRIAEMREWLKTNGVAFEPKMKKKQLYEKIKAFDYRRIYAIDQMIRNAGHIPLRTPPYCCEVN